MGKLYGDDGRVLTDEEADAEIRRIGSALARSQDDFGGESFLAFLKCAVVVVGIVAAVLLIGGR